MAKNTLKFIEIRGNLFDAPPNTLLVHACNCQGSWNAGIAKSFKDLYAYGYNDYQYICSKYKSLLLGKAHIILPTKIVEDTKEHNIKSINEVDRLNSDTHFIGCIFTSYYYGKLKDSEKDILRATETSVKDLLEQVSVWNQLDGYTKINQIRICKINSGLFGIPWTKTKKLLESIVVDNLPPISIEVVSL